MATKYYIVGGFVRDQLLGVRSKDIDLAVETSEGYEGMREDLIRKGIKIFLETPQYYTIRGSHPELGGVDYVLCRKDGSYSDGRRPDSVAIGTIFDDLARRDFTINAIAIDEETQELLDPFGGQEDLDSKIIRTVGDPHQRFREDFLRILRGIRFSIKYNFQIEEKTWKAMESFSEGVYSLPDDRIRDELYKSFSYDTPRTIEMLSKLNLLGLFNKDRTGLWLMPTNKDR